MCIAAMFVFCDADRLTDQTPQSARAFLWWTVEFACSPGDVGFLHLKVFRLSGKI